MKTNKEVLPRRVSLLTLSIIIACTLFPLLSHAQDLPDPGSSDVPFDGGVSALLIGGICYGVKKIRGARK